MRLRDLGKSPTIARCQEFQVWYVYWLEQHGESMAEERRVSIHGQWSSRWIFILAATGSAVGLGNIWKFPYITGENGGGAFVLVYLACIAVIGIPIMMAEVMMQLVSSELVDCHTNI